jgi:hypothetical protein
MQIRCRSFFIKTDLVRGLNYLDSIKSIHNFVIYKDKFITLNIIQVNYIHLKTILFLFENVQATKKNDTD